jgi:hypothetical protein
VSRDPQFVQKLSDVVGLYLNPPDKALVFCVDEKSQIQALDRTQPGLPLKPGRCGTLTHDYTRHGTTTLFAALSTLDGTVIGDCMPQHRHQEFIRFLKRLDQQTPRQRDLHLVVDNYATRKHPDGLLQLEDLKKQVAEFRRQEARVATPEQKAKVLALAQDLPRVWHAPTTQAKDRKRMLRLLLKDITVEKPSPPKQLLVHLRWQGEASTHLTVPVPLSIADRVRYPAALVDRVRELAHGLLDAEIANRLHREGHASAKGKPYTTRIVRWIRWRYQIPPATLRSPEELTVQLVAQHFGVNAYVVYYWIERNLIQARRLNQRMPYWITLTGSDEQKLQNRVRNSSRLQKGKVSPNDTAEGAL